MTAYKCFKCGKKTAEEKLRKRFVCPSCGCKIFNKPRVNSRKLKAI